MPVKKRGEVLTSTIVELIIGAAVAAVAIYLLILYFAPGYSEVDDKAESYLERVEVGIETVKEGGKGEFILLDNGKKELEFYLVYFGNKGSLAFGDDDKVFAPEKVGENRICVCYDNSENILCKFCSDLDLPVADRSWPISEGDRVSITREGGNYEFSIV